VQARPGLVCVCLQVSTVVLRGRWREGRHGCRRLTQSISR